jgi:hypothetical protein
MLEIPVLESESKLGSKVRRMNSSPRLEKLSL